MTKEELLEKAKRDYPVGAKFISRYGRKDAMTVTTNNHKIYDNGQGSTLITVSTDIGNGGKVGDKYATLYDFMDNKWAEIISRPEPEILPESYTVKCSNTCELREVAMWYAKKYNSKLTCYLDPKNIGDYKYFDIDKQHHSDRYQVNPHKGYPIIEYDSWKKITHEIPQEEVEYWEMIENSGWDKEYAIKGKIYPARESPPFSMHSWKLVLGSFSHYFKPSTRQAYEAQQSVTTKKRSLIDDIYNLAPSTQQKVNNVSQINNNQNEHKAKTIEVCGSDISIGRSDQIRGKGLDYSEGEITVGSGYRTNQGRSIQC